MNIGIYIITNVITSKYYVGGSIHIGNRWAQHKRELKLHIHGNERLQYAWIKYGEESFKFEVIEYCIKDLLLWREQIWLDKLKAADRYFGYNIKLNARSDLGKVHTEEYKKKMSKRLKGRTFSDEHIENIKLGVQNSEKDFKNKRNKNKWPHTKRCNCEICKLYHYSNNQNNALKRKVLNQYSIEAI